MKNSYSKKGGSKVSPKTIFHTPKSYGGLKNATYIRPQPK